MNVAKYPIIGLNQDDDDANLKPGWCREIWNAIPKNGYSKTGIQNLKGTLVRTNGSLAAGTNTCIGAFPDKANNRVLYMLHNSNTDHSVWYFSPLTNTHTLVLQTPYLNFSTSSPITSCDFIEDIANWCDDNNEDRSVIVSRAVAGLYTFNSQESFEKQLSLYKTPPLDPPSAVRFNDSGSNNISSHSYQFCVQYVYYDNTVSLISPLSEIDLAEVYPLSTSVAVRIVVGITVDSDIYGIVKKINWLYVRNDDGDFHLFKESDLDVDDPTRSDPNRSISFNGTETTQIIFPTQVNFIPHKSKNVVTHDQRVITTMNEFDYEGSDVTLSLALEAIGPISSTQFATKIFPPNTSVTVGFSYFDRFGRTPGITAQESINMPNIKKALKLTFDDQNTIIFSDQLRISVTPSGTAPSWATRYAISVKQNNTLESVYACLAFPMFYKRNGTDRAASEVEDNGKIYYETARDNWTQNIYWKVPLNVPFALDGSYKMRLLNSIGQVREVEDIIEVEGDKIVTKNFGIEDWNTLLGTTKGMVNVIFERYKEVQDEVFFEIGHVQSCTPGDPITGSHTLNGDHYYMLSKLVFERVTQGDIKYGGAFGNLLENPAASWEQIEVPVISQSPTHSNVVISDVQERVEKKKGRKFLRITSGLLGGVGTALGTVLPVAGAGLAAGGAILNAAGGNKPDEEVTQIASVKLVYSPDYTKIASDSGRPWINVKNKRVSYEPNTLSISDPYIINSKINGISDFRTLYQIPISRTPIRKMASIGSSNIILAVHERSTTSLATYSGGKILNTTDGSQIIGEGDHIIGYNNELAGGYGTIYPDSFVTHNGRAWWFDAFSGEVVRYANNGITPIGSIYKMHNFFREKGDQFCDPTGRNVIAGYNANLDILFLTFRSDTAEEEITVAFVDRQGEERWLSFEEFLPEKYAYINEKLYGFVDGVMWEFFANDTRNLFFGAQYTTRVRHLFNTEFSREKRLTSIGVESNKKWAFDPIAVAKFGVDQETSLAKSNFIRRDDVFYADVKRDKNTAIGLLPSGTVSSETTFSDFSSGWSNSSFGANGWTFGLSLDLNLLDLTSDKARHLFTFNSGSRYRIRVQFSTTILSGDPLIHLYLGNGSQTVVMTGSTPIDSNGIWDLEVEFIATESSSNIDFFVINHSAAADPGDMNLNVTQSVVSLITLRSALVAGQPMIGKVYDVTLENDDTELVELDFLNYGFIPQPGHNIV